MSSQIPAAQSDATHFVLSGIYEPPVTQLNDAPGKDILSVLLLRSGSDLDLQKYDVHGGFCVYGDLHSVRYRDNRCDSYLARYLVYGVFSSFSLVFLEITTPSVP